VHCTVAQASRLPERGRFAGGCRRDACATFLVFAMTRLNRECPLAHRNGWKNTKHAHQWVRTLKTYARPEIGAKLLDTHRHGRCIGDLESHPDQQDRDRQAGTRAHRGHPGLRGGARPTGTWQA